MTFKDTYADAKWRAACKERDGHRCRVPNCGRRSGLEVHHVFSRGYKATKTDPDNGVTLCIEHHGWAQQNTTSFQTWWAVVIGEERFVQLRAKALSCNGKLVPRPLPPEPESKDQAYPPSAPIEEALAPKGLHALLSGPACPDPLSTTGLAMALITVDTPGPEAAALCKDVERLSPGELKALVLVLAGVARAGIKRMPNPDQYRAMLGIALYEQASP
jgi:hypothetical protein